MERDVREVLEAAWNELHDHQKAPWTKLAVGDGMERFRRFLDAKAYTDAALMLLDRDRWRILSIHETEVEGNEPIEVRIGQRDAGFGRARVIYGMGADLAIAIAQAALKTKETDHAPE